MTEVEIRPLRGPLDEKRLEWVAGLYGRCDEKYRSLEYLRHTFVENPFGWSLHVFALDRERPVAHCSVVPIKARIGDRKVVSGKVEAFFIEADYRTAQLVGGQGDELLALALLRELFQLADENGVEVLHAFPSEELGLLTRMLGCRRVPAGAPSLVLVSSAVGATRVAQSRKGRIAGFVVFGLQNVWQEAVYAAARLAARGAKAALRPLEDRDADLGGSPELGAESWTISADDSWTWYCRSALLNVLEIEGRYGCRAVVERAGPVRVVSWKPERGGLLPALLLVGAAVRLARRAGAATVRFQPWQAETGDGRLTAACRIMGFVRRDDFSDVYVRSRSPVFIAPASLRMTPFFYVTF